MQELARGPLIFLLAATVALLAAGGTAFSQGVGTPTLTPSPDVTSPGGTPTAIPTAALLRPTPSPAEAEANRLLAAAPEKVRRLPFAQAIQAATVHEVDYVDAYVADLDHRLDVGVSGNIALELTGNRRERAHEIVHRVTCESADGRDPRLPG